MLGATAPVPSEQNPSFFSDFMWGRFKLQYLSLFIILKYPLASAESNSKWILKHKEQPSFICRAKVNTNAGRIDSIMDQNAMLRPNLPCFSFFFNHTSEADVQQVQACPLECCWNAFWVMRCIIISYCRWFRNRCDALNWRCFLCINRVHGAYFSDMLTAGGVQAKQHKHF